MEKAKRNIHYSFKVSPDEDAAIRQKMKASASGTDPLISGQ